MELKIISPLEGDFVKEIQWNNQELKAEIAEKMRDYTGLVFTEDTIKEAKKDRAALNKLKTAFDDERKRIKKQCMAPYDQFESQVKELIALIDEPIRLIDAQIKEVEEQKKAQKRKDIEELFGNIGFQFFVTLDKIWDDKWLNSTVSLRKIEEQMKSRMYQIGEEIVAIQKLPEFSFEAMEVYKKTMDLNKAIQEGQRLADIQKRKAAYEEEQRRRMEAENSRPVSTAQEEKETVISGTNTETMGSDHAVPDQQERILCLDFRVWGIREQILALRNYMQENHLKFGKVE